MYKFIRQNFPESSRNYFGIEKVYTYIVYLTTDIKRTITSFKKRFFFLEKFKCEIQKNGRLGKVM